MIRNAPVPTGMAVLATAQAGRFAEIRDLFAPQLRAMVSTEALQGAWAVALGQHGPVSSVGTPISEPAGAGTTVVKIPVTFEHRRLTLVVSVDETGWLIGLRQCGPTRRPVGAAGLRALGDVRRAGGDGRLWPTGGARHAEPATRAGVAARHRAARRFGTVDRDETMGRNKPLKDLAWGLASRGVAVLRFDKVTHAHQSQVVNLRDFTVADEYVHHAVAAVHLLRDHPAVDAALVFVLGHSLGGTVAREWPRASRLSPGW